MSEFELLIVFVIAAIILLLVLLRTKAPSRKRIALDKRFVQMKWQEIVEMSNRSDQAARFAVIEADKLLDHVLKVRGYPGETMSERMRSAEHDFTYKDDIWSAHKLRNRLVHEVDYRVDKHLVNQAVIRFQRALKDLGAL